MAIKIKELDKVLKNYDDEPYKHRDKDLTVKKALLISLDFDGPKNQPSDMNEEEKYRRFEIGQKLYKADKELEVSVEEASSLKKGIGMWAHHIYGTLKNIIDAPAKEEKKG